MNKLRNKAFYTTYTILLDENNNIKDVINHSNDGAGTTEITKLAQNILKGDIQERHIGCLYFEDYSYVYQENNSLTILDNTNIKDGLLKSLRISCLLFVIIEIVIIFISKIITKWITNIKNESSRMSLLITNLLELAASESKEAFEF